MLGASWKTSILGWIIIASDVVAFIADVATKQGIPSTLMEWLAFGMALATGIGLILAKDRDVSGAAKTVPVILLGIVFMGTTACATYHDAGNGHYNITKTTEDPHLFGTNMGFARIENCVGTKDPAYPLSSMKFSECNPVTQWIPMSSQGQGGQIVGGALTGLGFGLGSAFGASSGSSAISSSEATAISGGGKGH